MEIIYMNSDEESEKEYKHEEQEQAEKEDEEQEQDEYKHEVLVAGHASAAFAEKRVFEQFRDLPWCLCDLGLGCWWGSYLEVLWHAAHAERALLRQEGHALRL